MIVEIGSHEFRFPAQAKVVIKDGVARIKEGVGICRFDCGYSLDSQGIHDKNAEVAGEDCPKKPLGSKLQLMLANPGSHL